jgi:HD-like signal output (HDOD) protein
MRFFKPDPPPPVRQQTPERLSIPSVQLPPNIDGLPETELEAVYQAGSVKNLKKGALLFPEGPQSDPFFFILDGAIEVTAKLNGQAGQPTKFQRGDCIGALLPLPDVTYYAETVSDTSTIEISSSVLRHLPEKAQLWLYKAVAASAAKVSAHLRVINGDLSSKNLRLSQYTLNHAAARNAAIQADFVQGFLRNMKRLPTYATDLASKLLDEQTSVQEVVEGIRSDPSLVALVLRTVNSAQYSFNKKIESFYHACMILGFNNIYTLLMREATQSTMPITRETTRIHKHSCLISVLCYEIAATQGEEQSQTAATIGLLHDLGKGVQVVMKNANTDKADFISMLDSAKLGGNLLRVWGIPERICKVVEFQQQPDFMPPDLIAPEFRRDLATLHISHVLEMLIMEKPLDASRTIYTSEYMTLLGFGNLGPKELLSERIIPSLTRHRARIPVEIHNLILKPPPVNP